jgi:hypothetical protein
MPAAHYNIRNRNRDRAVTEKKQTSGKMLEEIKFKYIIFHERMILEGNSLKVMSGIKIGF